MDIRALIPAGAAVGFALFLSWKLLWRVRPAAPGGRVPLGPRIGEARRRAFASSGAQRAGALLEAGELCIEANRPIAAYGYLLRAARADPASPDVVRAMARVLARRRRTLERFLWRHLASLDWNAANAPAVTACLDALIQLQPHRRGADRWKAEVLRRVRLLLPPPAPPPVRAGAGDLSAPPPGTSTS